jgi:uncharacterized Rossmann fold enzyme
MDEPPFWLDEYAWIRDFLGIEESEDRRALGILQTYFAHKPCLLPDLRKRFSGRVAIVIGASESVLADLERLHHLRHLWEGKAFLVAADTATPLLLTKGMVPDIVVTDLDGPVEALVEASGAGSYIFVHGHGDNISSLREVLPLLGERVEPTTQVPMPQGHVHNFGGFTDGDRSAYVSVTLGARAVVLLGMCLRCGVSPLSAIGKAAEGGWVERKRKKLMVAERMLRRLAEWRRDVQLIDAGSMPSGVEGLLVEDLEEALKRTLR